MKRRKRRARQARRRNAFRVIVVAGVVTALCVAAFGSKKPEQVEERQQETTQEETTHAETVQNPETIVQTAEEIESKYKVFDTMSEDWGSCDLEGFVYYDLPEQYADKGYFPEKMQIYTRCLCKQNDVPYALVLALIEHESGYEFDKVGDSGQSKGYIKNQQEEIELYRSKIQAMEQELKEKAKAKPENTTSSEETIRLQTERDTYKTMYEQLLNRLVNGGAA